MMQDGGKMVYGKGTGIYCSKKIMRLKADAKWSLIWNPMVQIT